MKPAVHTLTRDQAVDELAAMLDSRPGDEDTLGVIHWKEANTPRALELEAWIMMQTYKDLPEPGPVEDAPPQHLETLPEPAKEKHVPVKKTPQEKHQSLVDAYHVLVDKLRDNPTNRRWRDDASTCKSRMSALEREFHLTRPELVPIPSIKMGRPAKAPEHKIGPGLYLPPTTEDLRAALGGQSSTPRVEQLTLDLARDLAAGLNDEVHHPAHYAGAVECIDAIRAALGDLMFVAHCRATAMKYLWRSGKKGPAKTDIEKAVWYCRKAAEVMDEMSIEKAG